MRLHLLFPLAFLSGIYGFFFFAPYLIAVVALGHLIRYRREAADRKQPVAVPMLISDSIQIADFARSV